MDLELTDEQRMIQDVARDFAEKELRPIAGIIDREARFPRETVRRMGELGLMGICVPEAWGGSGGDAVGYTVAAGLSTAAAAPDWASAGLKTLGLSVASHGVLAQVIFESSLPA